MKGETMCDSPWTSEVVQVVQIQHRSALSEAGDRAPSLSSQGLLEMGSW